jgi:hypothetical protein
MDNEMQAEKVLEYLDNNPNARPSVSWLQRKVLDCSYSEAEAFLDKMCEESDLRQELAIECSEGPLGSYPPENMPETVDCDLCFTEHQTEYLRKRKIYLKD